MFAVLGWGQAFHCAEDLGEIAGGGDAYGFADFFEGFIGETEKLFCFGDSYALQIGGDILAELPFEGF